MLKDLEGLVKRSSATLVEDVFGVLSLLVILVGALHLPAVL